MADSKSPSVPPAARALPVIKPPVSPTGQKPKPVVKRPMDVASLPFWIGLMCSIIWAGFIILCHRQAGPAHSFGGVPLVNWAIGISAATAPVAFIWMVAAYLQRGCRYSDDCRTPASPAALVTGRIRCGRSSHPPFQSGHPRAD